MSVYVHARSRARRRAVFSAATAAIVLACAASPAAAVGASEQPWASIFDTVRPVPLLSSHQLIVEFSDPSLGAWQAAQGRRATPAQQRRFIARAERRQQRILDAIRSAGVEFEVRHTYLRVFNGVSIIVHGDSSELIAQAKGVASVSTVRAVYPAASRRHIVTRANLSSVPAGATQRTTVAVLDTGIDFNHSALMGAQAGPGYDILGDHMGVDPSVHDQHGTEVASLVRAASRGSAVIEGYRVLASRPVMGGFEAVVGTSDDLLAGMERAVDPNEDGSSSDAPDVMLLALSEPYAGFEGTPEDSAVSALESLGVVVVAAAGNDGDSGDESGTVGAPGSASRALTVGAADMRESLHEGDLHLRGGVLDTSINGAPVLTSVVTAPDGRTEIVVIDETGDDPVDYLGDDLRSRVEGKVVLVSRRSGISIAKQVRAAADAGAVAVLVGSADDASLAGVVDAAGVTIPAFGISASAAAAIGEAASSDTVSCEAVVRQHANLQSGTVAGFSSVGPRHDGRGKPDVVAQGVGVSAATSGRRDGHEQYASISGTSAAAATVAGEVAFLRQQQPSWSARVVRAAMIGAAKPLGVVGNRPPVNRQGAGLAASDAAASMTRIAQPERLDFGVMAVGDSLAQPLSFVDPRSGTAAAGGELLLERDRESGPVPRMQGGSVVIDIAMGTEPGVYSGWIIDDTHDVRVPWLVVVRSAHDMSVPISATFTPADTAGDSGPGAREGVMQIGIGGTPVGGSLGIAGVQRLEIEMYDSKGRSLGVVGRLNWALPGVYSFGVSGRDSDGMPLARGDYRLDVRYVASLTPGAPWRMGPSATVSVTRVR